MKKIFLCILRFLAKCVYNKHKPFVVGVTGTVGKTTVTDFVYTYLQSIYGDNVYKSPYGYNGEFGLPLTILQSRTPGKNPIKWLGLIGQTCKLLLGSYPKYLVLEYGIDSPHEMEFLLSIAKPDIGILTNISPNHVENFSNFSEYKEQKLLLVQHSKTSIVHESIVVQSDYTYGVQKSSFAKLEDIQTDVGSIQSSVSIEKKAYTFTAPLTWAYHAINIGVIYCIAYELGHNLDDIAKTTSTFSLAAGRGSVFKGKNDSVIIDGSYNAGVQSMKEGLAYVKDTKKQLPVILLLGDMRELWSSEQALHEDLIPTILDIQPDLVVLVGDKMKQYISHQLLQKAVDVHSFISSADAWNFLKKYIMDSKTQYYIFVKGSQGSGGAGSIFLEEAIKPILKNKKDTSKLCRQNPAWIKKKQSFFNSL